MGKKRLNHKNEKFETFLLKLNEILNNKSYSQIINWTNDGESIIVKDHNELTKKVLPKFFKHHNYASFVRQLNMYNFHKIRTDSNSNEQLFKHDKFIKGISIDKIKKMKRKIYDNDSTDFSFKDDVCYNQYKMNDVKKNNKIEESINYLINKTNENTNTQQLLQKQIDELTKQNLLLMEKIDINNRQLIIQNNFNKKFDGINLFIKALFTNFYENTYHQQNPNFNLYNTNFNLRNKVSPTFTKKNNIVEKGENFSINNSMSNESKNFNIKINESFNDNDNISMESFPNKNYFDFDMNFQKNFHNINYLNTLKKEKNY